MNYFFTLEGIEGAGKSTVKNFFEDFFKVHNLPYLMTREPGGTKISEKIRQILLEEHQEKMFNDTELLLYFASRAQHLNQVVLPALKQGMNVISDRFTEATFAYQCGGRGIAWEKVAILEQLVQKNFRPHKIFLLDLPVEIGLSRIKNRGYLDRIEKETVFFFEKVRKTYLEMAKRFPKRFQILDATLSLDLLKKEIFQILKQMFNL